MDSTRKAKVFNTCSVSVFSKKVNCDQMFNTININNEEKGTSQNRERTG